MRLIEATALLILGCAPRHPTIITGPAPLPASGIPDSTYGYSTANPIKVGGVSSGFTGGPENEYQYLERLRGPHGQHVTYSRLGSCCPFRSPHGLIDSTGLLDAYEVSHRGLAAPVTLYLDFYDQDTLRAPVGFVLR